MILNDGRKMDSGHFFFVVFCEFKVHRVLKFNKVVHFYDNNYDLIVIVYFNLNLSIYSERVNLNFKRNNKFRS